MVNNKKSGDSPSPLERIIMTDNIIDLGLCRKARREPLQTSQEKLLARLKKKYEPKHIQPERLIWAREMYGFSQEDWADIMSVTVETIQAWEAGTCEPSAEQLETYCMDMFLPGWFYQPVDDLWPGIDQTSLRFH
jgi:DNA-binding transcriptional regulator YiaG